MDPHENVLRRGPRPDDKLRDQFAALVDSCVNFGTHLFNWLASGEQVPPHRVLAALMLRHFLAYLDGVASLLRTGCPEPIKLSLRGAFETYLNLLYLATGSDAPRRALCYGLVARHRVIAAVERRDPTTKSGRRLSEAIARDTSGFKGPILVPDALLPSLEKLKAELAEEPLAELEAEWKRTKSKDGSRFPKWYQLFGGPRNLEQLADDLGNASLYEVLYREFSAIAHNEAVLQHLEHRGPAERAIPELRDAAELQLLTSIAISLALLCYTAMIEKLLGPTHREKLSAWYVAEIKDGYKVVASDNELIQVNKEPDRKD